MRMDLQGAAKRDRGLAELAERHMAEPLAGSGAEMIRIARQRLPAVGDGGRETAQHEARGGALVPALGEAGVELDDAAEEGQRRRPCRSGSIAPFLQRARR